MSVGVGSFQYRQQMRRLGVACTIFPSVLRFFFEACTRTLGPLPIGRAIHLGQYSMKSRKFRRNCVSTLRKILPQNGRRTHDERLFFGWSIPVKRSEIGTWQASVSFSSCLYIVWRLPLRLGLLRQ